MVAEQYRDWQHRYGPRRPTPTAELSDVERLLAYEEIRQLAARYALAVDSRDVGALVELFVEDVHASPGITGREALRAVFEAPLRADRVSILQISTHVINLVDVDHAYGTVYCRCEMGDDGKWARQMIAYEDSYQRRQGRWYFVRRKHQLFYGTETDERPLAQEEARWPERPVGRGTVPFEWPTWKAFWMSAGPALSQGRRGP